MNSDWPKVRLTDIYDIRSSLYKPAASFGYGFPFIAFKDVFNNFFLPEKLTKLVQSTDSERIQCDVRQGDIFLTRTSETLDELGMSGVDLKSYPNATFNGFTKRLRPRTKNQRQIYHEYIGYYLRSQSFRRGMLAQSSMSTRASLNNEMIGRLEVMLPPIDIQKIIAKALKCLDDKIDLNRRINQTLTELSRSKLAELITLAPHKDVLSTFDALISSLKAKISAKERESLKLAELRDTVLPKLLTGELPVVEMEVPA